MDKINELMEVIDGMNKMDNKDIKELIDEYNTLSTLQTKVKTLIENYRPVLIEHIKNEKEKVVDMKGNHTNLRSTRVDSFEVCQNTESFDKFLEKFSEGEYRDDIVHSMNVTVENENIEKLMKLLKKESIVFDISKESYSVINKNIDSVSELKDIIAVSHSYRFKKIK